MSQAMFINVLVIALAVTIGFLLHAPLIGLAVGLGLSLLAQIV